MPNDKSRAGRAPIIGHRIRDERPFPAAVAELMVQAKA
jgi:hypothetical protein